MERHGLISIIKKGLTVKVIIRMWKILPKNRCHILSLGKYQIRAEENNSMDYQLTSRVFVSWVHPGLSQLGPLSKMRLYNSQLIRICEKILS